MKKRKLMPQASKGEKTGKYNEWISLRFLKTKTGFIHTVVCITRVSSTGFYDVRDDPCVFLSRINDRTEYVRVS